MDFRKFARDCQKNGHPLHNAAAIRALGAIHHRINDKAALAASIEKHSENGMIGVIRSGMDCDCTQYHRETVIPVPASIVQYLREEDEHAAWLDGPESWYFEKPSRTEDGTHKSRDRALEAYEDGHPGVVYWGDL